MIEVTNKIHRMLAPRLVVLVGTTSKDGRKNIIPINNITPVSVDPSMVLIAVYKKWITAETLKTTSGFTISIPHKDQLDLVWKLGQKYSGYNSGKDKIEEFKQDLDLNFFPFGPVLNDALGWIEYEVIDLPKDPGTDHLLVIGKVTKAVANPKYYDNEIVPIGNPKPFMQWTGNKFAEASDIFSTDYFTN